MKLRKMTAAAVFCAILAVLSQIAIPLPAGVPVTLQLFGVALCGCCLGWQGGLVAVGVYLLLGGCGLPVFSAFGSGLGWLLGPTGGFLWGFLPLAVCCGLRVKKPWQPLLSGAGLAVCHLMGVVQFAVVTGNSMAGAFVIASLPYLVKDILLVLFARWLAKKLPKGFFE